MSATLAEPFPAVCAAAPGRYAGVVRDVIGDAVIYCPHVHKRRSTALRCAEALLAASVTCVGCADPVNHPHAFDCEG